MNHDRNKHMSQNQIASATIKEFSEGYTLMKILEISQISDDNNQAVPIREAFSELRERFKQHKTEKLHNTNL